MYYRTIKKKSTATFSHGRLGISWKAVVLAGGCTGRYDKHTGYLGLRNHSGHADPKDILTSQPQNRRHAYMCPVQTGNDVPL